ncbi:hypothetical protein SAMN05216371_7055 [Streptomyces sp. TLI_053]|uniref:hypothetical protein n=1 Tax=Streptomyces sp. TLI_053 TaxID=1855352 RepID=UPI00087B33CD|nr:hypothetical protein [Streptomyces sp. TLI_053]SDT82260.1 hypothetical protein SAMN05216371_7055 [Streptomyces sp. TLI_053]
MRTDVRIATAALVAITALTAAAPLATAAQSSHTTRPTASVLTADVEAVQLTPAELAEIQRIADEIKQDAVQEEGPLPGYTVYSGKGDAAKKIIGLLKKSPALFKSAVSKAKEGKGAFDSWMGKQNIIVRGAWWAAGGYAQGVAWEELNKMVG